jgi:hypothetical protein
LTTDVCCRRTGGKYAKGYVVSWLNHAVLVIYLIPWAAIVIAEQGCSCETLWRA